MKAITNRTTFRRLHGGRRGGWQWLTGWACWLVLGSIGLTNSAGPCSAATMWLDADPGGTTSNVNIQSAVYDSNTGQVTDWGTYRDYRFQLSSSPSATITDVGLRLSVSKSSAGFSAPLNVTWFAESVTPYAAMPDLQTALGTISASDVPATAFAAYVIGPGPLDSSANITASVTAYWIRIWAATTGGNDKYQTKLAPNIELEYESTDANLTMYNYDEGTGSFSNTAANTSGNIVVPEPAWPAGGLLCFAIGKIGLAFRRRWIRGVGSALSAPG